MTNEIRIDTPIVAIRPTAPIRKTDKGFAVDIEYTLEDGRTVPSSIVRTRKKDVVAHLAELAANGDAPTCPTRAIFYDDRFIGTRTTIRIGGAA